MLYHFAAKIISRAKGQSVCAAAAYRSGEKIANEYDGIKYDYRNKENIENTIIMLPDNAPAEFADLKTLWNSVEKNEKQSNAQLAREIEIALPNELSKEARDKIAIEFVQTNLVDNGMIAQLSFHNKPNMNSMNQPIDMEGNIVTDPSNFIFNNPHVHILLPMRSLDERGKWESKKQKVYICEKNGKQRRFTSGELKTKPGWEKQFNYVDPTGKRSWHTKSYVENHPELALTLVNRYPRSESIVNPILERWNSKEFLLELREAWAKKVNVVYEALGMDERVDHRSYADQGLDLIPTIHEGKAVTIAEKRLKEEYDRKMANGEDAVLQHTDVRNMNIAIKQHNQEIRIIAEMKRLRQQMAQIIKPVKDRISAFEESVAEQLERIRAELITIRIRIQKIVALKGAVDEKIKAARAYISDLNPARKSRIESLKRESQNLKKQYNATSRLSINKKKELLSRMESINDEVSLLKENRKLAVNARKEITLLWEEFEKASEQIGELEAIYSEKKSEYIKIGENIPKDQMEAVDQKRLDIRTDIENKIGREEHTAISDYHKMSEKIDRELGCSIQILSVNIPFQQERTISLKIKR